MYTDENQHLLMLPAGTSIIDLGRHHPVRVQFIEEPVISADASICANL